MMFNGKKLKDMTEDDIRQYAASLAGGGGGAAASAEAPAAADASAAQADGGAGGEAAAAAEALAEPMGEWTLVAAGGGGDGEEELAVEAEGRQLALARREGEEDEARRKRQMAELEKERQKRLSQEEEARLQVLAEMERSQMPAVCGEGGLLQKTIEHYTFADTEDVATIAIELDKDLFEGAGQFITEQNVEVSAKDTEVTILFHGVPTSKTVPTLAEWRLHISPLFHSVDPAATKWKIRKGKVSVQLKKRKRQDWRRLVKF